LRPYNQSLINFQLFISYYFPLLPTISYYFPPIPLTMYPNIDRLDTLTFWWLKNGVMTLKKILKKLGNPQDSFKIFHVAWTNGKWSTCQMISQVLRKQFWLKVGLTISPHLIKLNERIQINWVMISNEDLDYYLSQTFALTLQHNCTLSFFEHMILVALLYFRDQKVDYAVIEVGLWWKYDATNVFSSPEATIITTISDDHRSILWPTLTQIFWNKFGICKKNVPCFTRLDTALVHRAAKMKKVPLQVVKKHSLTNLPGTHQQENAWVVLHCLSTLWFGKTLITEWLMQINHPGRCQRIRNNVLVDGAHNEEWIDAFVAYVKTKTVWYKKVVTVFWSTKKREEYPRFFSHLIPGDINYLVTPSIENRAIPPSNYQFHLTFDAIDAWTRQELSEHLDMTDRETLFIVYGSLYLVWEVIGWFED